MARIPRRLAVALALVILTWSFVPLALAQEESPTTITGTETTVAETGLEPAVPVEPEEEAAPTPDWTYRYLIPTALVLTVLIVLVTSTRYFSDVVRKRYRVIEERPSRAVSSAASLVPTHSPRPITAPRWLPS